MLPGSVAIDQTLHMTDDVEAWFYRLVWAWCLRREKEVAVVNE